MTGAQAILKFLGHQGIEAVFGYPGGAIMPLYDALLDSPIRHYLCRHEQGAAFAAIGQARSTNSVGVCVATSGPGATNLLTSLADAKLDSVPLVVITGQVARPAMGTDAFQEVDVLGLSLSISKHSMQVLDGKDLLPSLERAFFIAQDGRPGPVLVDIPKDILLSEVSFPALKPVQPNTTTSADADLIAKANQLLAQAKRPLAYVGGGVGMAEAVPQLRDFITTNSLPTVSTLKGLGAADADHPLYLGMLGMHGLPAANLAVQECDLLIAIGARLDDRVTGKLDEFAPHAKLLHLDIDPAEIHKRRQADVAILGDLQAILPQLQGPASAAWCHHIAQRKAAKAYNYSQADDAENIHAPTLLHYLSEQTKREAIVSCDVGQHQMWVAQHMTFADPTRHLSSGGLGTMGFGLPAAIGAQVAHPDKAVIAVCGDGSFMMNVQELATLRRYGLPVKILVLDNQRLGMVKQWQELFHQERYSETDLSDNPPFSRLAQAFDIAAEEISEPSQVQEAVARMLAHQGPYLLHVRLDANANVWPIVPPNTANHQMWEQPQ
ncbi:acetolactate synthase 2 catalytic subunit [Aliiglaciecola sp. CAU 1673]|uniref:acetolactate synthase 2 catalytic subunit n=1 Tax=Aliiglaciecola sp. CAU 1673 TaxID=3032595 RepID=UPI0023DA5DF9|nr:acetolactate synthase 2 catalytic subunit [Aliiglaciecola sp. CAU 1673]MDF2179082.1 acetolactate synthase 2 catalytic subunit [Aliiglaciecola sp. CAU 1673]